MSTYAFFSNRDALLVAIPFLLLMFFALFGLSDRSGRAKVKPETRQGRTGCGMDANGEPIVCDPDGQLNAALPRQASNRPAR